MRGQCWVALTALVLAEASLLAPAMAESAAKPALDFGFYRARVEPIFLKKKAGHTRCVVCHADANNGFKLEHLSPGQAAWTEEQSRRNFEMVVQHLVVPGDPANSRLTMHPLAPEAGGDAYHSGGRQFASKNDRDFKVLVQFINGAKAK